MSPLLEARAISKTFPVGTEQLTVLHRINLAIEPGEMTAIVGASGSGKTTLLKILGTLDTPSGGELFFEKASLIRKGDRELAQFRNRSLGFIFQFHHLMPEFTALENVMMPASSPGATGKSWRTPPGNCSPGSNSITAANTGSRNSPAANSSGPPWPGP